MNSPLFRAGLVTLLGLFLVNASQAGPLKAGAATSNITPKIGSSINGNMTDIRAAQIHDELHARAIVLDDGTSRLAIVVCDACMLDRSLIVAAKAKIEKATGIPAGRVLISATHSHSCGTLAGIFQSDPDPSYMAFVVDRIADGVQRAVNNLAPAQIGWGQGSNDRQVFNRRWKTIPGTVNRDPLGNETDRVRTNPGIKNPVVTEPAGPTDPSIPVVSIQTIDGKPIALLANYSLHYVGGVGSRHISADYFGTFADRVQELLKADRLDPPFVAMMTNGTSGDINNINFRGGQTALPPYGRIKLVANDVAEEAIKPLATIAYQKEVTLDARDAVLRLGVRKPSAAELVRAESLIKSRNGQALRGSDEYYARESLLLSKYPDSVDVPLQVLRIGNLGIAAIPCEVFVEIGLELKRKSAIQPMFTISLANGYNGYLPTPEHHKLGGYETWRARSSYLEVDASPKITAKLLELFQELKAARRP